MNVPNDSNGFKIENSPDFSGSLGVRYALTLGGGELALSGNLYHTSKFYFDTSQQFAQDGYELLSLRAEWTDPSNRYTFAMYGDNVTDEEYRTMAQANATGIGAGWGAPAITRRFDPGEILRSDRSCWPYGTDTDTQGSSADQCARSSRRAQCRQPGDGRRTGGCVQLRG